jgi:hypothetical protein
MFMFKFICPRFIFKVEKWKWNKEFRLYVSNTGKFKDEHKQPIPIKLNQNGYVVIKTRNGYQTAHRLVMKTWMPTEDMDNLTVDHLDHNKRNNCVDNLEWVTESENKRRAANDHLPSAAKKAKKEEQKQKQADAIQAATEGRRMTKAERRQLSRMCPNRYHNSNLTFNDLIFYVNGVECPDVDTAIATAKVIFENSVQEGGPGPQLVHWQETVVRQKYESLLSMCRHFNNKVIDGKDGLCVYLYLNLTVKVKEDI